MSLIVMCVVLENLYSKRLYVAKGNYTLAAIL